MDVDYESNFLISSKHQRLTKQCTLYTKFAKSTWKQLENVKNNVDKPVNWHIYENIND